MTRDCDVCDGNDWRQELHPVGNGRLAWLPVCQLCGCIDETSAYVACCSRPETEHTTERNKTYVQYYPAL